MFDGSSPGSRRYGINSRLTIGGAETAQDASSDDRDHEPELITDSPFVSLTGASCADEEDRHDQNEHADACDGEWELVRCYFRSMSGVSVPTSKEALAIAQRLVTGRDKIRALVTALPLFRRTADALLVPAAGKKTPAGDDAHEKALARSLSLLHELFKRLDAADALASGGRRYKKNRANAISKAKTSTINSGEYSDIEKSAGMSIVRLRSIRQELSLAERLVEEAQHELVLRNLRLVVASARNFLGKGLSLLDLVQEGSIGLMRAAEKYDPEKGKFSTYALWWIRQSLTRAVIDQAKTIRVPVHVMEFNSKVSKTARGLSHRLGRQPTTDEIAIELGVEVARIESLMLAVQEPVALQVPLGDEEISLESCIKDTNALLPDQAAEQVEMKKKISAAFALLSPKERHVLCLRFGLGGERDHTLEEVGRRLRITRERARQIESQALRKLRHPRAARLLADLLSA